MCYNRCPYFWEGREGNDRCSLPSGQMCVEDIEDYDAFEDEYCANEEEEEEW